MGSGQTGAKITRKTNNPGVSGADTAENETPSYSEVELEGNEVNLWPYLSSIMQCKLCLPRETKLPAYKISTSTLRKHVEMRGQHGGQRRREKKDDSDCCIL